MINLDAGLFILIILTVGISLLIVISRKDKPKRRQSRTMQRGLGKGQFQAEWMRVEQLIQAPGVESTKSAIFEADKLLDIALRQQGFRGETMGERLKSARNHFHNNAVYQGMWEAHKMRNALAHELSFELPRVVAQQQLDKFKAGLQYLKVI